MKEKSIRRMILLVGIKLVCLSYITWLLEPDFQAEFKEWVSDMGTAGLLAVFGIQVLQIVIAIIPGEPVEVVAGVLYGTISGTLICLLGCILASSIIFTLSKRFGKRLLYHMFSEEKVNSWRWLQDSKKVDTATFILFFIPGTPKDMLTYMVGVSEMKRGKFLVISTLARIPSILSSTMAGSAMRQGEWEISILVFALTGIVGIAGILYKDKMIGFCRKITGHDKAFTKSQCLDFIETAHRDKLYPIVTCRMKYDGQINVARLIEAVRLSSVTVPEILYAYNYGRGGFVDAGFTASDVVQAGKEQFEQGWKWDFSKSTQLKLLVCEGELIAGISHILCDGDGFLQYLYLLASLYDGARPDETICNRRDISPLLDGIKVQPATEQERHGKGSPTLSLQTDSSTESYFCLSTQIGAADMTAIHAKAKSKGATLNDVFLTAYARVLANLLDAETVLLPCPADLRRFKNNDALTVANMTGMYKIAVEIQPSHAFEATLAQVQIEMHLQKERRRCFSGIRLLWLTYNKLPPRLINWVIKKSCTILPLSYTNIGVIDSHRLSLNGITITDCFLTGTYRYPSDFQLSISTFQNIGTLNCTLLGGSERKETGQKILNLVKLELQAWVGSGLQASSAGQ